MADLRCKGPAARESPADAAIGSCGRWVTPNDTKHQSSLPENLHAPPKWKLHHVPTALPDLSRGGLFVRGNFLGLRL